MSLTVFLNPGSRTSPAVLEALERAGGYDIRRAGPGELPRLLHDAVSGGVPRVVVAGGDGTVELAAAALAGTPVELAVLPAGTLNHFARDHEIPTDPAEALALARDGEAQPIDVGYVNDRLFINTSSVGAYVRFVRTRDRIGRFAGYWLASLIAGIRVLMTPTLIPVRLETEGEVHLYRTPLVFVGVGERRLKLPGLGRRVPDGARGLHVLLPRGRQQARRFARAYGRVSRGLPVEEKTFGLDSALVNAFRLDLPSPGATVAMDGEICRTSAPLDYRYAADAVRVVVPNSPRR